MEVLLEIRIIGHEDFKISMKERGFWGFPGQILSLLGYTLEPKRIMRACASSSNTALLMIATSSGFSLIGENYQII
jgi:hypothetical protein